MTFNQNRYLCFPLISPVFVYMSYHLAFDNGGRLKTKLRHDDFTFPIVNYPFISCNIPASPAYGVYISQLIRYSRACAKYSDFLHRAQLLTQKLLKQGYVAPRLTSSLLTFYDRHYNLVDRYEIFLSQMTMALILFTQNFLSSITAKTFTGLDSIYE